LETLVVNLPTAELMSGLASRDNHKHLMRMRAACLCNTPSRMKSASDIDRSGKHGAGADFNFYWTVLASDAAAVMLRRHFMMFDAT